MSLFATSLIDIEGQPPPIHFHHHSYSSFPSFVATLFLLFVRWHRTLLHMTSFFITSIPSFLSMSHLYMFIQKISKSLCFYFVVMSYHFKIFLVFTLQARELLCFVLIALHFVLKFVLHWVLIMLFIVYELLLLCSLCNVHVHHIAIILN